MKGACVVLLARLGDFLDVLQRPLVQRVERRRERAPERRDRVLDANGRAVVDGPTHETVPLEGSQSVRENPLRDEQVVVKHVAAPNPGGHVNAIVIYGSVRVAGLFTNIGGQFRNNIAALDPVTAARVGGAGLRA